jgi:hypothetical protein
MSVTKTNVSGVQIAAFMDLIYFIRILPSTIPGPILKLGHVKEVIFVKLDKWMRLRSSRVVTVSDWSTYITNLKIPFLIITLLNRAAARLSDLFLGNKFDHF